MARQIVLTEEERKTLRRRSRGRSTPVGLVMRARIVLLAADGLHNKGIAPKIGSDPFMVAR